MTNLSAGRPAYHFIAPRGWMNDPCAPGYDPKTGLYHLFYQWTPNSHCWAKIAWGHATSRDLLHWEHSSPDTPVLMPDQDYDDEGVFTGCFWPTGPRGEAGLTVFYTNVNHLPVHYTLPYARECEGLSMATSSDGGKNWNKSPANPILREEPPNLTVTGFRDPFLAPWPAMDAALGRSGGLYGLISGGIKNIGPRTFLYAVNPSNVAEWAYVCPLLRVPSHHKPGGKWGGDLGLNLECTNFLSLSAATESGAAVEREVIVTGSEGGHARSRGGEPRYGPWVMGTLGPADDGQVDLMVTASGLVDWGQLYAFNTFQDRQRTVMWGWLIEEDVPEDLLRKKGWTGCLGVPREVFIATYSGVSGALVSPLPAIGSFEVLSSPSGVATVTTLGIRPLPELSDLRTTRLFETANFDGSHLPVTRAAPLACKLEATIAITDATEEVALHVRHSLEKSTGTTIAFFPQQERIVVQRDKSNLDKSILKTDEEGAFTLLRLAGGIELFKLQIFLDADIIEVFANDRFALATRVYTPPDICGISYSCRGTATVQKLELWEMQATQ